jgi:hypothetical protein
MLTCKRVVNNNNAVSRFAARFFQFQPPSCEPLFGDDGAPALQMAFCFDFSPVLSDRFVHVKVKGQANAATLHAKRKMGENSLAHFLNRRCLPRAVQNQVS